MKSFLTRTILLVSFVSLFTDIASEMLYPVMPVYLRSIGFSVILIGILEGLAEATAGFSKGYFGKFSDVLTKRVPFVRWGYTLSALSKPMMAAFTFPWWIFLARTMDRLGKGVRTAARDAMLSDESTPENKGKVFGFHRALDTVGAALGPFSALIYLHYYPAHYRTMFIIAVIPGIIAIMLTLLLHEKPAVKRSTGSPGFFSHLSYWKTSNSYYKFLVAGLLAFTLFNSSDAFLLLAIKNKGFSDEAMIGFYIFYNLLYALFAFPIGILADRIGLHKILIAGLSVFSIVYFFMGFALAFWQFAFLFGFYALYAASSEGISKALISNVVEKKDTATAIGFFSGFASIFALLASSLAGLLWYSLGPQWMFIISASGVALTTIYMSLVLKGRSIVKQTS
ncbi:MAG: MFS transporter [Bacteroidetes bacterium]|nr:MFS transporter [Bacteroidota bacterium]